MDSEDKTTAVSVVASLSGFKREAEESTQVVMSCDTAEETDVSISSRSTFNERTAKMPRLDCHGQMHNTVDTMIVPSQVSSVPSALPEILQSHPQDMSQSETTQSQASPPFGPHPPTTDNAKQPPSLDGKFPPANLQKRTLKLAPFFYYRDFSQTIDEDPLIPLTPLARVPNFPAKMHSILSRPSLSDVVSWMPHGRSWRVLKPRDFEIRVIPTYFEHQKFSSFIRQANGWGFRRITQGRDRNSYYHELFLRGVPHLCKKMKRPGVNKKVTVDAEHEPEFYAISEMHALPGGSSADVNLLLPSSLLGRNNWNNSRIPPGMNDMIGSSYGAQPTPVTISSSSAAAMVTSQGQSYNQDAAMEHDQNQALAALSSIHGRSNLYSQLKGLTKPDPTPRTNAASVLTSNQPSSRLHYTQQNLPSLSVLQQALRHQQQTQNEGSNSNQAPASQQATLAAIAAALNISMHDQNNNNTRSTQSPQQTSNQAQSVTNSILQQSQQQHKPPSYSSQNMPLSQQVQLAAIQRATSALQHAMSPAAAAATALAAQRCNNASPPPQSQSPRDMMDIHQAVGSSINGKQKAATLGDATSQFAAGFAAATALSNSQVRSAVNEALANHAAANRQQQGVGGRGVESDDGGGIGGGVGGIDGNVGGGGVGQRREDGGSTREQRYMYSPGNFYK